MKFLIKKYLPEFVYGSVDGVVTTVAIITGAVGAGLSAHIIFIMGMANVFADGFSMGSSTYLSNLSKNDLDEDGTRHNAFSNGLATFTSFIMAGLIPVIPFFVSVLFPSFSKYDVIVSLGLSFLVFVIIGYIGARVTKTSRRKNILRTVLVGSLAAFISFIVGYLLRNIA